MKKTIFIILAVLLLCSCAEKANSSQGISLSQAPISESSVSIEESSAESSSLETSSEQPDVTSLDSSIPKNTSGDTEIEMKPVVKEECAWWQEGLSKEKIDPMESDDGNFPYFYIYDDSKKLSYSSRWIFSKARAYYSLDLLLNTAKETDDIGKRVYEDRFFEIVALDDTKYTGEFYEKGILLTQALPGEDKGRKVMLSLDESDYKQIINNMNEIIKKPNNLAKASWLSMMRRSRITSIDITSSDGKAEKSYGGFDFHIYEQVNATVTNCRATSEKSLSDAAKVEIKFNNELVYNIYYTDKNILISASDVDSSLIYDIDDDYNLKIINDLANGTTANPAKKPVIYLYPTEKTDCNVKLDYQKFTYTYPAYNDGWNVTAYPDGRLVNKADNTEHYYLFWEGNEYVNWDFSEGFVVKGSDTESFLREKLAFMGLTSREYNDFITYWVPQMKNSNYNLITFAKKQYEELAPLTVSPTPDSVLRVHMVFKNIDSPIKIKEQKLEPFTRKGFTVVEWGGTNAN